MTWGTFWFCYVGHTRDIGIRSSIAELYRQHNVFTGVYGKEGGN